MSLDAARLARSIGTGRPSSDYDLNADVALLPERKLRPAAVLVAVDESGVAPRVILTKRASHLKHHPGQIAFPGGKLDAGDADAAACALREAHEEIGLPGAEVLGSIAPHETVTGYSVTPVLARIRDGFDPRPEPGEVAEVFSVPLGFLMAQGNFRIERRRWRGAWRRYYVIPYGPYYIWGATARMLKALADQVRDAD